MGKLTTRYGDTALVTGASSGIGREIARELAREGFANLVIVARRENRLRELAEELRSAHGTEVLSVPLDLTEPDAVQTLMGKVRERGWNVDVLVNNVATVNYGWFGDIELDRELAMIDLNCKVPVELIYRCLPHMKERGRGGILTIGGIMDRVRAGGLSTYCGTKAFEAVMSECLNEELNGSGVDVVCLSPGYTPDTEVYETAGIEGTFPFPRSSARGVARRAVRALTKRKPHAVDGFLNNVIMFTLKFTPIRMRQVINRVMAGTPDERRATAT